MVQTRLIPSQPALILEEKNRYLIVTDLHIGFESNLAANEIFVDSGTKVQEILDQLYSLIDSENPDSLILLGDVKASIKSITRSEWDNVPKFFEKIKEKIDTLLVPGNHDGNIQKLVPDGVTVSSKSGFVIENTLLTHGHALPSENLSHIDKIIMGHVHPTTRRTRGPGTRPTSWPAARCRSTRRSPSTRSADRSPCPPWAGRW